MKLEVFSEGEGFRTNILPGNEPATYLQSAHMLGALIAHLADSYVIERKERDKEKVEYDVAYTWLLEQVQDYAAYKLELYKSGQYKSQRIQ